MNDTILMVAGVGGMSIALAHGYIGHHKILKHINGLPPTLLRINYAVFQLSTLYWFVGGIVLLGAPFFIDTTARFMVTAIVAFLYFAGAVLNFWITRGRHFGSYALAAMAALALLGG